MVFQSVTEREENNVDGEREEECKDVDSNDYPNTTESSLVRLTIHATGSDIFSISNQHKSDGQDS